MTYHLEEAEVRDRDIRESLKESLLRKHLDDPNTKVIEEYEIDMGEVRVDIAVVNGSINGYEIKSDRDTLERLPKQIEHYSKVLDYSYLIVGEKHYQRALEILPDDWGIYIVSQNLSIDMIKEAKHNSKVNLLSLALLLWRDEAVDFVREIKCTPKKLSSMTKRQATAFLSENCCYQELNDYVRYCIKNRTDWRVVQPQKLNGD